MAIMDNYKPVRVFKKITVSDVNEDELKRKYPHAEKATRIKGAPRTMAQSAVYAPGQVIDAPTDEERKLFDSMKGCVTLIPQHHGGFDDPRTSLARSREGSFKGRQKFLQEMAMRKPVTEPKPKSEVKAVEPEAVKAEPEPFKRDYHVSKKENKTKFEEIIEPEPVKVEDKSNE